MKKKCCIFLSLFLLICAGAMAQQIRVTGKVRATNGEPVIGASVTPLGSETGALTDETGSFAISVEAGTRLLISSAGYASREVLASATPLDVQLETAKVNMDEVVVIGYQTASRKSVTTAISSVSAKEIEGFVTGNVANAIQGKLAGVQVISGNGLPGSQPTILVRGLSSLNGNTTPLVIVDGIEVSYNALNLINPLDIASIDVLKDASASAIYGSRAGQGVLLVTTKRGKGKATINLDASVGTDILRNPGIASGQEYMRAMNQVASNSGIAPYFPNTDIPTYNHWDDAFDAGLRQNYVLSASGAKDGLSFYGSMGFYRQDSYNATSRGGNWNKVTARLNVDYAINDVFKLGVNFSPRYESWLNSPDVTYNAYTADPTTAPFKTVDSVYRDISLAGLDSTYEVAFNPYYSQFNRSPFNNVDNPLGTFARNFGQSDLFGAQYAAYLEVRPLKNLVVKTMFEGFANSTNSTGYNPKFFIASNALNRQEQVSQNTQSDYRWKITNTANYKFDIKNHNVDVLIGQSADNYIVKGTNITKTGIPFDLEPYRYVSAAPVVLDGGGYNQAGANPFGKMFSLFGSLRYNYANKYFISGTMRRDQTSLVNPLYNVGYFPTISGAWIISDENFFDNVKLVNYLKLRASWGRAGGNFPQQVGAYLSFIGPYNYVNSLGQVETGRVVTEINNPELRWEEQQDLTLGLDANLFNNRMSFSLEVYERNPRNLLADIQLLPSLGYPQGYIPTQRSNVATMRTRGIDLSLGYNGEIGTKFKYGANLVVSHWKSITGFIGNGDPFRYNLQNDAITTSRSRLTEGSEPGAWFGYIVDGVFQTDQEAAQYVNRNGDMLQPQARAGDLKFRDANGDGLVNDDDLTDIGSPWPKLTSGLTLTASYGRVDFRTEFYGAFGHSYSNDYRLLMQGGTRLNFTSGLADKFWDGPGSTNEFPIRRVNDPNGNFSKMSTFMIERADFVRCRLIQLGYSFPKGAIKGFNSFRVYASGQNLFTFTKYSGLNPELPFQGIGLNGIDRFTSLVPKSFLFGVSLNF